METLTSGQRAATRMILETSDRFTVVQGYAGVGKTTQFRAVMSAVNMLPESERPRVVGLGPTHRAVGEMRSAGVDAQTLASFLHDTQLQQRSGETPDFSNTLFLLDESSMVGNTDMARAYALIAAGGGRAVASGDTDQLQAIAPGQPFRLQQTRSAADVAIMKEIVRQTPELREAVYSLINRDVEKALSGLESVKPSQVPRLEGAWAPEHSVTEFSHSQEAKLAEAQQKAMLKGEAFPDIPMTLYEAIVRDYTGRTSGRKRNAVLPVVVNSVLWDVMCQSNWSLSAAPLRLSKHNVRNRPVAGATISCRHQYLQNPLHAVMPERGFWPMLSPGNMQTICRYTASQKYTVVREWS
ncbi:hypothetical protein ESCOMA044M1_22745 [Escherichia coli]